MQRKTVPLAGIKTADLPEGSFEGWASTFGNVDAVGDRVMPGAFTKSISSGRTVPLLWMHRSEDPTSFVGEVVNAVETPEGLKIHGKFDLDTAQGAAAYKQVKARRVEALSIGYRVNTATKGADGVNELRDLDLVEVSVVTRGANPEATIGAVKSAPAPGIPTAPIRSALARAAAARITTDQKAGPTVSIRTEMLTKTRETAVTSIKSLLDAADADKRDLTPEESTEVETLTKTIADCDSGFAQVKADDAIMAKAREFALAVGPAGPAKPATEGHLALTGTHVKRLAAAVVTSMPKAPQGTKALFTPGTATTSTIVLPEVITEGRPAVSVLDVLPMRIVAPNYSYLRQNDRDFAAAPTAAGDLKPESVVSVEAVENRLRVVAHISEGLDKYTLSDATNLQNFVASEMLYGLRRGLETQILTGDGTGENFTGVLETSGIQLQTFSTNILTSVRKALTKIDVAGHVAGVIVLSAADWEAIELLTATSGATDRAVPIDPVARRLWGVNVVLNQGLGAGVGLVIGDGAVVLDHDGVIETLWSDAVSDDFKRNKLRCRVEGRFGVSVSQPAAVVQVETAA
jgi:HK97 family phage prohead protease/HK97 family phage major capsid protein